jgi:ribosomal protein L37AE/L43A
MFTEEELEDENEIQYFYSLCKSKLDHLQQGIDNTIWRCNECMACYDTNVQDLPLKKY